MVRVDCLFKSDNNFFLSCNFAVAYNNAQCINTTWHMLKRNAIVLKHAQNSSCKSKFAVHHWFFNKHNAIAFFACNTSDDILICAVTLCNNHCTRMFWLKCIANVDWNIVVSYWEDWLWMQNICTHICKFSQFTIRQFCNVSRIFNNSWVANHKAVYICPVFIYTCICSSCNNCTCNIWTTSWKSFDISICVRTIKTRDNCSFHIFKSLASKLVCCFCIKIAIAVKFNQILRVNKLYTKFACHNNSTQKLSARCSKITWTIFDNAIINFIQIFVYVNIQFQILNDFNISFTDLVKSFFTLSIKLDFVIASIKHIGYFSVIAVSFARSRNNNITPFLVAVDNICNIVDIIAVCHWSTTKFTYFSIHNISPKL